ncbi:MAG: hypothetical protein Q9170_008095 [Blastenia crenularia]
MVPESDRRVADLHAWAGVISRDVRRVWIERTRAEELILVNVNDVLKRDDRPWWNPIVVHNRRVKAEKEARVVNERFGNVALADQATKKHIAHLINNDLIDLILFKSRVIPPNKHGLRPPLSALYAKHRAETEEAFLDTFAQRLRDRVLNAGYALDTTQSGIDTAPQSSVNGQTPAITHVAELDQTSSTTQEVDTSRTENRESIASPIMQGASDDYIVNRLGDYQQGRTEVKADKLGQDTMRESPEITDTEGDIQLSEFQGSPVKDDTAVVMPASTKRFTLNIPSIAADRAAESPHAAKNSEPRVKHFDTVGKQFPIAPADLAVHIPHPLHTELAEIPPFIELDSQKRHHQLSEISSPLTPVDESIQSSSLSTSHSVSRLESILTKQPSNRLLRGPPRSDPRDHVATQDSRFPFTADTSSARVFTQGHALPVLGRHTATYGHRSAFEVSYYTAYAVRWNYVKWAYRTHTFADFELQRQGIWLYDRPKALLDPQNRNSFATMAKQGKLAIVIKASNPNNESANAPSISSNGSTLVLHVHQHPWDNDFRRTGHTGAIIPDMVFNTRLTTYQALEVCGYPPWRHDRDLLTCKNPACGRPVSDMVVTTLICLGCGPKARVRWCSKECLLRDQKHHSMECGLDLFLITNVIDDATAPPRFSHLVPSIRARNGRRTWPLHRQRVFAQANGGHYTLFDPQSGEPTILYFDINTSHLTELEARMERCLNIALYDDTQILAVAHLALLVALCLKSKGAFNPFLASVVTDQFAEEFDFRLDDAYHSLVDQPVCECEWVGDEVPQDQHAVGCVSRSRSQGDVFSDGQRSVKSLVEAMEAKHWILRAWQSQNPVEKDPKRRIMGHGFLNCLLPAGWMPCMGKGWLGFWAPDDDICA